MDPRFLIVLLAATASSCGGGGDCGPRSALLITLDTTRYDALGCTGAPPGVSPNLDALAAEGVLYEQARTVCPLTVPAHASMLTGLYPLRHTVHMNSMLALPSSAHTLAERASQRGFQTAAFIAAVVLAADYGLAQGFERYDQPTPPLVIISFQPDRTVTIDYEGGGHTSGVRDDLTVLFFKAKSPSGEVRTSIEGAVTEPPSRLLRPIDHASTTQSIRSAWGSWNTDETTSYCASLCPGSAGNGELPLENVNRVVLRRRATD